MAHGGKRDGAGRKPVPDIALLEKQHPGPTSGTERACYGRILEALNTPEPKPGAKAREDTREVARWRKFADAQDLRIALDTLKYLYDKRDGKAIQPVDVDATLESSVIIDLGPLMPKEFREARQRGNTSSLHR